MESVAAQCLLSCGLNLKKWECTVFGEICCWLWCTYTAISIWIYFESILVFDLWYVHWHRNASSDWSNRFSLFIEFQWIPNDSNECFVENGHNFKSICNFNQCDGYACIFWFEMESVQITNMILFENHKSMQYAVWSMDAFENVLINIDCWTLKCKWSK